MVSSTKRRFAKFLKISEDEIFAIEESQNAYRVGANDVSRSARAQMVSSFRFSAKKGNKRSATIQGFSYTHTFRNESMFEKAFIECMNFCKSEYMRRYFINYDGYNITHVKGSTFFYHFIPKDDIDVRSKKQLNKEADIEAEYDEN